MNDTTTAVHPPPETALPAVREVDVNLRVNGQVRVERLDTRVPCSTRFGTG